MNWDANHAGFVLASYALTALVVAALVYWIIARDRAMKRRLSDHEASHQRSSSHDQQR